MTPWQWTSLRRWHQQSGTNPGWQLKSAVSPEGNTGSTRNTRGQEVLQIGRLSSRQRKKHLSRSSLWGWNILKTRIVGVLMDGDTKPFWTYLKTLKQDCIDLLPLRHGGALYTAGKDKARIVLKEFGSVFTIEDISCILWLGHSGHHIDTAVEQEARVRKLLQRLKPRNVSGLDRIPNMVLKELADELTPPLSAVFNQSLESGCIPDDWSKVVCSTSLMALLIRSVGRLSKCVYQGLWMADLNADVIGQSINRRGVTLITWLVLPFLHDFCMEFHSDPRGHGRSYEARGIC